MKIISRKKVMKLRLFLLTLIMMLMMTGASVAGDRGIWSNFWVSNAYADDADDAGDCEEGKVWRDNECRDPKNGHDGDKDDDDNDGQIVYVEVPGPTVYVDVPGETIFVNVPGPEVIVEVPVEVIVEVPGPEVIVELPGETVYVDVPGPETTVYVDVPGPEVIVEVPGPEVIVEVDKIVPVDFGTPHYANHAELAKGGASSCTNCHSENGFAKPATDKALLSEWNYSYEGNALIDPTTGLIATDPISGAQIISGGSTAVLTVGQSIMCRDCHYPHDQGGGWVPQGAEKHEGCIDCH
jgi:hypothetical protein